MLVDVKATLLKKVADKEAAQLQALKETLDSKDFEVRLSMSSVNTHSLASIDCTQHSAFGLSALTKSYCLCY